MMRLAFWISTCVLLGLPYVLTEAGVARRYRGKRKLPDASYLLVPAVYEKMKERGMIYQEGPDLSWTIQFIPNDGQGKNRFYCPEKVQMTIDLQREPVLIVHRKCDSSKLGTGNCLTIGAETPSFLCVQQEYFRNVRIKGREMYQKVFTGCGCSVESKKSTGR